MEAVYMKLVEMSISASWLVLAVLVLRLALKKSPKWIHVALWALVAVRMICPVTVSSGFSLSPVDLTERIVEDIPNSYVGPSHAYWDFLPEFQEAVDAGAEPIHGGEGHYYVITGETPQTPVLTTRYIGSWVWAGGILLMLLHALISYSRLKKKVAPSVDVGNGVFICDYIDTPFILGIVRPKIYLPSSMEPDSASHVLAHERAHIARKDHWWKPLGYVLLTVHWFNPVIWLAYILLCRDIELACDEKVIWDMALPQKKAYSEALLSCSVNRRSIAACPLAFGEVGVKERVKSVLNYKKPAFWIVALAILSLIVTAACFLTDPVARTDKAAVQWFEEYAYENVKERMDRHEVICLDAREGYALIYCQGQGPTLTLYRYEKKGDGFRILDSCAGDYAISGGMSLNHLEDKGKHIYFGTASQYHWNPKVEVNTWINWDYMTLTDINGKLYKKDMTGKKGFLFVLDAPMADFQAVDGLGTECLNVKKFTEQGYYMVEAVFESGKPSITSNPYAWTSTLAVRDIRKAWSYQEGQRLLTNTIEGNMLDEMVSLFNSIDEDEILIREFSGKEDPYWDFQCASVQLLCDDGANIRLRYQDDLVIIDADTDSGLWETDGYWIIENEDVKAWMRSISLGGTDMLSDENRDEIRSLLRQEYVHFFNPRKYDDLLFVGCYYDGGRGMGVAVYEPLADGYRLLKLIRGDEVRSCASGSEVYYCDYGDLRIFLILNQNITGMEWSGAYEKAYAIDTHPGLMVEYFPEKLNTMYRFLYNGGAATMYMDRNNQTYGQPPEYADDPFGDPDNAYSICSNLRLNQVGMIWAQAILEPDAYHLQSFVTELSRAQIVDFLDLLRSLPETAYEQAQFPAEGTYSLEVFVFDVPTYPWLSMKYYEDAVYFQFHSDAQTVHQSWKINSAEMCAYIDHFFVGDISQWVCFAPYPKKEGEISGRFGDVEIVVPQYAGFEYEVSEKGLRFKPKAENGWVLLKYLDKPYAPEDSALNLFNGKHFGYNSIRGCYEGVEVWAFVDITIPDGEKENHILLLNEEGASWVEPYDHDIGWMLDMNEMEIRDIG